MRIKKVSQTTAIQTQVVDGYSTSTIVEIVMGTIRGVCHE